MNPKAGHNLHYGVVIDSIWNRKGLTVPVGGEYKDSFLSTLNNVVAWRSQYAFDQEGVDFIKKQAVNNKGITADFKGKVYVTEPILDFDGDPELVYADVNRMIMNLHKYMDADLEHIRVYRSGRKGVHVHLDGRLFDIYPTMHSASILKATVEKLFPYETLDTAPLGIHSHIRLPFSKHEKSGRMKTSLDPSVFFKSFEEFQGQMDRDLFLDPVMPEEDPEPVLKQHLLMGVTNSKWRNDLRVVVEPTRYYTCMQKLINKEPALGNRHEELLRLSSWLWRIGLPIDHAETVLADWLSDTTMADELKRIVKSAYARKYAYGCKDKIMKKNCSSSCVFYPKKNNVMEFESPEDLAVHLGVYIDKIRNGKYIDLGSRYGGESYKLVPGELMVITADTGMGKSMLVQDIVMAEQRKTVYLNLEMPKHLLFRRFLQTAYASTKDEIEDMIVQGRNITDKVSHIAMHSDSITIDTIEQAVQSMRPEILVVDTTDGITVKEAGNNEFFKMGRILEGLRGIAQKQNIIVICVHHLNKSGARETQGVVNMKGETVRRELQLTDLTGKQDIVTKVDHVLALEGDRDLDTRTLRSMKSRDSKPLDVRLRFNFERQTVHTLEQQQTVFIDG